METKIPTATIANTSKEVELLNNKTIMTNNSNQMNEVQTTTTVTPSLPFIHRVELKGLTNEQRIRLVEEAVKSHRVLQILLTPGVDMNNNPYYWVGLRYDRNEIVFKMLINGEVEAFVDSFLKGETEYPTISNYTPDTVSVTKDEWFIEHRARHYAYAKKVEETLEQSDGRSFMNAKMKFSRGKISYSHEIPDVLSFLKATDTTTDQTVTPDEQ